MSESKHDREFERVKKAAEALGEHFDTVQIFVTLHDPSKEGGTVSANFGIGNWFARTGQINEWIQINDQQITEKVYWKVRAEEGIDDDEDDDDDDDDDDDGEAAKIA